MASLISNQNYKVITGLSVDDAPGVLALYRQTWWAKDRNLESTRAVMAGSTSCIGVIDPSGRLLGFARVLSDGVEKATIFDVIVDNQYLGTGIGLLIMNALLESPTCNKVKHVELYCKEEMMPFYYKMGFEDITDTVKLLRRIKK